MVNSVALLSLVLLLLLGVLKSASICIVKLASSPDVLKSMAVSWVVLLLDLLVSVGTRLKLGLALVNTPMS